MPDIVCENLPMPVRDVIEDRAPVEVSFNLSKDYADKILSASGYVVGCRSKIEGGYVLFGGKAVFNLVFMGDGAERLETALRFDFKKALPSENYKWGETVYRLEDLSWSPSDGGVTLSATLNYRVDLFGEETVPFVKDFVGLKKQ